MIPISKYNFNIMYRFYTTPFYFFLIPFITISQAIRDDFEGYGNIAEWYGDIFNIDTQFANPFVGGINQSTTVLRYVDNGGLYANVRFDENNNFDDIAEIWQYYAHLSFSDSKYTFNYMLEEKLQDIQHKLTEVHTKLVKQ